MTLRDCAAQQPAAADALQPPLRCGFQARLSRSVSFLHSVVFMPKRSNRFQRLVALLHASLGEDGHVIESAMVTDKISGQQREVDILLTMNAASYTVNIAVEVVGRGRKADTAWVKSMQAKHASLPTHKLVLVAEQEFTAQALKKASFYGIEALTIDSALETDWKLASALTANGFFELTTFKYSCSAIYQTSDGGREQLKLPNNGVITANKVQITLDDFVRYVLALPLVKDSLYPPDNFFFRARFLVLLQRPGWHFGRGCEWWKRFHN